MKTHALGHNIFFQIKSGLFAIVEIAINTATTTSLFKVFIFTVHITFSNGINNNSNNDNNYNNNNNNNKKEDEC